MKHTKVCIAGLGQVGLATASYMRNKGLTVFGYDINAAAVQRARQSGFGAFASPDKVPECSVYIVSVSTAMKDNRPDLSPIYEVCTAIGRVSTDETLVSIESTVVPGTCRKVFRTALKGRGLLVHVPHRYWAADPVRYGVRQVRAIGAMTSTGMDKGIEFYSGTLDVPLHPVPSLEVAEMCKITENAYRFVQIAFAEELRMVCDELGLDFQELRLACNAKWNIELLEARNGILGHCLPKDTTYFTWLSRINTLARTAIRSDKKYKRWIDDKRIQKACPLNGSVDQRC